MRLITLVLLAGLFGACNKPVADFLLKGENKTAPAIISFENQSKKAVEYKWDFGDGNTSTDPNPSHRYLSSGNYAVQLTVSDGKKSDQMEKRLHIDSPEKCLVEIQTDHGNMLVELFDATPGHRDNFVKLAEEGFYDELLFHRVIDGFMIQGGDPESRDAEPTRRLGSGGPGYQVPAEFVDSLVHVKGAIAAARQGDPVNPEKKSSGSQFYIVHGKTVSQAQLESLATRKRRRYAPEQIETYEQLGGTPFLDGEYTVFGRVIDGLDVIDRIAGVETGQADRPVEDVKMKVVVIR